MSIRVRPRNIFFFDVQKAVPVPEENKHILQVYLISACYRFFIAKFTDE